MPLLRRETTDCQSQKEKKRNFVLVLFDPPSAQIVYGFELRSTCVSIDIAAK